MAQNTNNKNSKFLKFGIEKNTVEEDEQYETFCYCYRFGINNDFLD